MLYITQIPEIGAGGDTCFLSAYEAYETLSPAMKAFLEGLDAVHDGAKPYTGGYGKDAPEGGCPRPNIRTLRALPGRAKSSFILHLRFPPTTTREHRRQTQ